MNTFNMNVSGCKKKKKKAKIAAAAPTRGKNTTINYICLIKRAAKSQE